MASICSSMVAGGGATMLSFKPYHIDVPLTAGGQCKKSLGKSYFDPTLTEKVVAVKSSKSLGCPKEAEQKMR